MYSNKQLVEPVQKTVELEVHGHVEKKVGMGFGG